MGVTNFFCFRLQVSLDWNGDWKEEYESLSILRWSSILMSHDGHCLAHWRPTIMGKSDDSSKRLCAIIWIQGNVEQSVNDVFDPYAS